MNSGTENLDWTARALRRIVEFTQRGGEINIVVDALSVGAQSYWNAVTKSKARRTSRAGFSA